MTFDRDMLVVDERHLIDRLRAVGLDKYIELPGIAVMGDTSSGKSSVLSAISGITFPSSDKLTTRCPTQLILSHTDKPLAGSVRMDRYSTSTTDDASPKKQATSIKSIEEVTEAISRLTQQLVDEGQHISDDAIVIELSGSNFPNLTLTDLPGLIRTVNDDEDPTMITRVAKLVQRYLDQKRTIILAVVPANVDVHNTEILQAAELVDPDGMRTISIITKPDLIDEGAEQSVIDLLHNRTKKLRLGYHVVKCRGQKALAEKITIAKGLEREMDFFETDPIWSKVDMSLCGIGKLGTKLSNLLQQIVTASLPSVISEIIAQEKKCMERLTEMGPPLDTVGARRVAFITRVNTVIHLAESSLTGAYDNNFFDSAGEHDNRFRAIIRTKDVAFQKAVHEMSIVEIAENSVDRSPVVGDYVEVQLYGLWKISKVTLVDRENVRTALTGTSAWRSRPGGWRFAPELNFDDLKAVIAANRGDELSIFPSYLTFCTIVRQKYISKWRLPMNELFKEYSQLLRQVMKRAIEFSSKSCPSVGDHMRYVAEEILQGLEDKLQHILHQALDSEFRPYSLNHYLFDILMKLRTDPLLHALDALSCGDPSANVPLGAVKAILKTHAGIGNDSNEEQEAKEMHMALTAYLQVAKKRFTDKIPMLLQHRLLEPFVKSVKSRLTTTDATDAILELILNDPLNVIQERRGLNEQLQSLKKANQAMRMK